MDVLRVVAHPDDEVIGVGGTLARHAEKGDDVGVVILSDGVSSRYETIDDEATAEIRQRRERATRVCERLGVENVSIHEFPDNQFDTVPLLDIVQTIEAEIDDASPTVLHTHHYGDLNIDYQLTCRAVVTAARPLVNTSVKRVLAFETLSSTEWSFHDTSNNFAQTYLSILVILLIKRSVLLNSR